MEAIEQILTDRLRVMIGRGNREAEQRIRNSIAELHATRDELRALREQNAEMREVLDDIEWSGWFNCWLREGWIADACPCCNGVREDPKDKGSEYAVGHKPDCRLAKAIGRTT